MKKSLLSVLGCLVTVICCAEEDWGGAAIDWAWRQEGEGVALVRKMAKRQDAPIVRKAASYFSPVTQYVGAVKIPERTNGMPVRALKDSLCEGAPMLEAVLIPPSVRTVGLHAFKDCGNLKRVVVSEGVVSMDNGVFLSCTNLVSVELPSTLREVGAEMFYGCSSLKVVKYPKGLTSVGPSQFYGCKALRSFPLPKGLQKIPPAAFSGCESADGGRTWGDMSKTPILGFPPHFLTLADGRILCTYANREIRHEMAVVSKDQGRTWDVENSILLSKGPTPDMGYPSTVENDDGTLLTVYYQSERSEKSEIGKKRKKSKEDPCLMATKWRLK